jgi:hypothetical protein
MEVSGIKAEGRMVGCTEGRKKKQKQINCRTLKGCAYQYIWPSPVNTRDGRRNKDKTNIENSKFENWNKTTGVGCVFSVRAALT